MKKNKTNPRKGKEIMLLKDYFLRNGYLRKKNSDLHKELGSKFYKKGYEVRIVLNDMEELKSVQSAISKSGLKVCNPFKKHLKFVQPIYGKEITEIFEGFRNKH